MNVFERIYSVVRTIPKGKVATYGQIAMYAGNPHWARVVGYALNVCPDPDNIPWHRVVSKGGRLSTSYEENGVNLQRRLLEEEGVEFLPDGRVDMKRFGWGRDE